MLLFLFLVIFRLTKAQLPGNIVLEQDPRQQDPFYRDYYARAGGMPLASVNSVVHNVKHQSDLRFSIWDDLPSHIRRPGYTTTTTTEATITRSTVPWVRGRPRLGFNHRNPSWYQRFSDADAAETGREAGADYEDEVYETPPPRPRRPLRPANRGRRPPQAPVRVKVPKPDELIENGDGLDLAVGGEGTKSDEKAASEGTKKDEKSGKETKKEKLTKKADEDEGQKVEKDSIVADPKDKEGSDKDGKKDEEKNGDIDLADVKNQGIQHLKKDTPKKNSEGTKEDNDDDEGTKKKDDDKRSKKKKKSKDKDEKEEDDKKKKNKKKDKKKGKKSVSEDEEEEDDENEDDNSSELQKIDGDVKVPKNVDNETDIEDEDDENEEDDGDAEEEEDDESAMKKKRKAKKGGKRRKEEDYDEEDQEEEEEEEKDDDEEEMEKKNNKKKKKCNKKNNKNQSNQHRPPHRSNYQGPSSIPPNMVAYPTFDTYENMAATTTPPATKPSPMDEYNEKGDDYHDFEMMDCKDAENENDDDNEDNDEEEKKPKKKKNKSKKGKNKKNKKKNKKKKGKKHHFQSLDYLTSKEKLDQGKRNRGQILDELHASDDLKKLKKNSKPDMGFDCTTTVDEFPLKCDAWQSAGFCETNQATKFLWCRKTCLCSNQILKTPTTTTANTP